MKPLIIFSLILLCGCVNTQYQGTIAEKKNYDFVVSHPDGDIVLGPVSILDCSQKQEALYNQPHRQWAVCAPSEQK